MLQYKQLNTISVLTSINALDESFLDMYVMHLVL